VLSAGGETRPVPSEPVPISATMLESSPRYSRRPSRPSIPKTRWLYSRSSPPRDGRPPPENTGSCSRPTNRRNRA